MQVASADAAVVFDLQTLGASAALDACLASVLGCGSGGGGGSSDGSLSVSSFHTGSGRSRGAPLPGMGRPAARDAGEVRSNSSAGGAAITADRAVAELSHRLSEEAAASAPAAPATTGNGAGDATRTAGLGAAAEPRFDTDVHAWRPPPVKCGVGISEDLTRLARTHPGVRAFRRIPRVLDLRHPWQALQLQQVTIL